MKYKNIRLYGIFLFLLMLSITSVSASCEWATYGDTFTPLWNEKLGGASICYGRFSSVTSANSSSMVAGMSAGTQPLIFTYSDTPYLVLSQGNYLSIYNGNLGLYSQKNVGTIYTQPDILDWDNNGYVNDIAVLVKYNTTHYSLKVFSFAPILTQIYEYNISTSTTTPTFTGFRHSGNSLVFVYDYNSTLTYFTQINKSGLVKNYTIPSGVYVEPLAWWDINNDGEIEYMTYSSGDGVFKGGSVVIFNEFSSMNITTPLTTETIFDAHIYPVCQKSGCDWWDIINPCVCNAEWKIAVLWGRSNAGVWSPYVNIKSYNVDGSTFWSKSLVSDVSTSKTAFGTMAISDDYNGDGYADIYATAYINPQTDMHLYIFDGTTGTTLENGIQYENGGTTMKLTLADINHNGRQDFILAQSGSYPTIYVYDPYTKRHLTNNLSFQPTPVIDPNTYCIPADLNKDGYLEIICAGATNTYQFYSNTSNDNPTISSITFDPSTTIQKQTSLNAIITAFDTEGNSIFYSHKCSDSDSWSAVNNNPTQTCYYADVGSFNFSVRVRDFFHSTYNSFSQTIIVTFSGTLCGNDICEAGETNINCPNDCPSNVTQTQATETGGMPIPTKIVDVSNTEQGLLPEIYYGILGFLSNTLSPMIILVFVIFFTMIILAIAFIIKRVAHKVGELAH